MKTRLITSGIAVVLALTLIILGSFFSIVITVALSLVSVILCGEYLSAKKINKNLKVFIPCLAFAFLIPLFSYFEEPYGFIGYIPFYLFIITMCVLAVVFHKDFHALDMMFTVFGVGVFTVSLSLINILACGDKEHTAFWVVLCLAVPWLADSAAYFAGKFLGKHKLCPNISPNKTIEGAIGGVLGGTLGALLIGGIFNLIHFGGTVYYGVLLLVGLVNSVISIFGDLTFSVIKRGCNIKDYGSIMPGHGGLLDRFDSVVFTVPFVFIISQFFMFIE